jgi:hypothetical protein
MPLLASLLPRVSSLGKPDVRKVSFLRISPKDFSGCKELGFKKI